MEGTKILEKVDIFHGLSPNQLESLAQISEETRYRTGEVIFAEHSSSHTSYLVRERLRIKHQQMDHSLFMLGLRKSINWFTMQIS